MAVKQFLQYHLREMRERSSDVLQVDCPNVMLCLINDKIFDIYNICFPIINRTVRIYKDKLGPWMRSTFAKWKSDQHSLSSTLHQTLSFMDWKLRWASHFLDYKE